MEEFIDATTESSEQLTARQLMHDLRLDFRLALADAEELLRVTADQTGERIEEARARLQISLRAAKGDVLRAGRAVQDSAADAARTIDRAVHEKPWNAFAIAAGIGLVIGIVVGLSHHARARLRMSGQRY